MKLIQTFALVTAMAVFASAQGTSTNTQGAGAAASGTATSDQKKSDQKKSDQKKNDQKKKKTTPATKASAAGKGTQKPADNGPIKMVVPKTSSQPAASDSKTNASGKNTKTPVKTGVQPAAGQTSATGTTKTAGATTKASGSSTASKPPAAAGKTGATQKTPVLAVTPATKTQTAKTPATKTPATKTDKTNKTTKTAQKTAPKVTTKPAAQKVQKKVQPKIVEQKTAAGKKPADTTASSITKNKSGRRDPFLSPIRNVGTATVKPRCITGKRCLYIPELTVQGTAKDTDGKMVAAVTDPAMGHRPYFLRENDQVFNGTVEKITSDSVIFREYATDNMGRESAHEVVKRLGPHS